MRYSKLSSKSPTRILMIEDDQEDFEIVSDLLKEASPSQYELEWEPDADVAIQKAKKQNYDVFIIDYRLNKKTGLEVLGEISILNLDKPMILLTGYKDHQLDLVALENGAWDFLSKNQITGELLERSIRYSIKRAEDLRKIRESEIYLREKNAAEASSRSKSEFLANMSHEMRTPLSAILGFCELAQDNNLDPEELSEYLNTISRNGKHLLELINEILDLSKIEAGQLRMDSQRCDWKKEIYNIIETLKPKFAEKQTQLKFHFDKDLPLGILTDSRRFHQVLMNLIGNAIKFTQKGAIIVDVSRVYTSLGNKPNLSISVHDTGIGIDPAEQWKLFRPFSQVNSSPNRSNEGTGLGLDLSRKLARLLGGELTLRKSQLGVGSTFNFTLPLVPAAGLAVSENQIENTWKGTKLNILVVDDSVDNSLLVQHFLTKAGHSVEKAFNARDGITKALRGNFDLVLMDIQMPGMDGCEAVNELRSLNYKKPIVALSSHALNHDVDRALQLGFDAYVTKPVSRHELFSILEKLSMKASADRSVTSNVN